MAQYRNGIINSTTALISSGVTLNLGFVPDRFTILNYTKTVAGSGVGFSDWIRNVTANATALISTYTAGAPVVTLLASTGVTAVETGGNWQNTLYTITGISTATPAVVTVSSPTPTNSMALANGMTFTISSVVGCTNVNQRRFIVSGLSGSTFNLYDTFGNAVTASGTYVSGGQMDVISYQPTAPVLDGVTGQVTTPGSPAGLQYDTGYAGVSLGAGVLGSNGDKLYYEAWLETPTGY
jgi:hypothetical protein